ncbi:E3 ISG15--protein ligase HERC5 [Plecturocebus cupreus]
MVAEHRKGNPREIFISCLSNWKFLRKRRTIEMTPANLDLNKARNIFKALTQKDWITNMLTTCLKESLVVLFAKVVCKMSDQSSLVLEEYWATLQESTFCKLVQMFKTAGICQITERMVMFKLS